jgi:alkylation response protein AidB-like acyl-CoA dehydrogenase
MTVAPPPQTAHVPSLLYGETEDELRDVVRRMLGDISPWSAVVDRLDQPVSYDERLWQALRDAGIPGLLIPDDLGGAGVGAREMAVVMEEMGRAAAPVPLLTSGGIATATLLATGAGGEPWLRQLAAGDAIAALAVDGGRRCDQAANPAVQAAGADTDGCTLTGRIEGVIGADAATVLLVPAGSGDVLAVVEAGAASIDPVPSLDMTRRLAHVMLDAAPATVIARGDAAADAVRRGLLTGTALLASEQLGTAEQALEIACEHLRTRYQFGRLLGSFQALRHRAADLWTAITGARAVARYAAACLDDALPDAELAAHLAEAVCADVALDTAEACLQMMGGIGFTWENPTHLLLKRAAASHAFLATPERHRSRIAELREIAPVPQ